MTWSSLTGLNLKLMFPSIGPISPAPTYEERKKLILASGDLLDAFWNTGFSDYDIVTYGGGGMLLPLQDMVAQHAPNIATAFERYPALKAAATAPDGNLYTIPTMIQMGPVSGIGAIRFFHSALCLTGGARMNSGASLSARACRMSAVPPCSIPLTIWRIGSISDRCWLVIRRAIPSTA